MFDPAGIQVRDYGAGESMAPHEHDEVSMSVIVRGGFQETIGRVERTYARGEVTYCPAGVAHAQAFGGGGARQIIFRPPADWIDYLADRKVALGDGPHARTAFFETLGDRLLGEMAGSDAFSALACEGLLLELVAAFGRTCGQETPATQLPTWLTTAREFVHENALRPISLQEIATAAGRHEIHLAREFRRFFGCSIGAYQRRLRLEHAVRLLGQRGLRLSEVALDCGFSSHAHFCRDFKRHYGLTPSEHRNRSFET